METKKENIQNLSKHDLKKIIILGTIVLAILITVGLMEKQTGFLVKISEFLL